MYMQLTWSSDLEAVNMYNMLQVVKWWILYIKQLL